MKMQMRHLLPETVVDQYLKMVDDTEFLRDHLGRAIQHVERLGWCLVEVFVEHGFKSLTNPAARATFAKTVTIKQACKIHKVNESEFLDEMNSFIESGAASGTSPQTTGDNKVAGDSAGKPTTAASPDITDSSGRTCRLTMI